MRTMDSYQARILFAEFLRRLSSSTLFSWAIVGCFLWGFGSCRGVGGVMTICILAFGKKIFGSGEETSCFGLWFCVVSPLLYKAMIENKSPLTCEACSDGFFTCECLFDWGRDLLPSLDRWRFLWNDGRFPCSRLFSSKGSSSANSGHDMVLRMVVASSIGTIVFLRLRILECGRSEIVGTECRCWFMSRWDFGLLEMRFPIVVLVVFFEETRSED